MRGDPPIRIHEDFKRRFIERFGAQGVPPHVAEREWNKLDLGEYDDMSPGEIADEIMARWED